MNLDNFAWSEEEARQRQELAKLDGKQLMGLEVVLSCMLWPLQTKEQKGRKAGLFLNRFLDFCYCLKLFCAVVKKKKKMVRTYLMQQYLITARRSFSMISLSVNIVH